MQHISPTIGKWGALGIQKIMLLGIAREESDRQKGVKVVYRGHEGSCMSW